MIKILDSLRNTFGNPQGKAKKKLADAGISPTFESMLKAVDDRDIEAVKLLVETGVNVNQADSAGNSPLVRTILNGDSEMAVCLIRSGANVDVRDNAGFSAVMLCVKLERLKIMEDVINAGADVNVKNHETKETALIMAAQNGNLQAVELLLKNAITSEDRDATDKKGMTAAGWGVKNGHTSVVELLCEKKASVNVQDVSGQTPLMYAAAAGDRTMAELLLRFGANKELTDRKGDSARSIAAQSNHLAVLELLEGNSRSNKSSGSAG